MVDSVYWIWFQEIFGIGTRRAAEVLEHITEPVNLYHISKEKLTAMSLFTEKEIHDLQNTSLDKAQQHYDDAVKLGYEVLTPYDMRYPESLRNIYSMPLTLYVKGDISVLEEKLAIGVIGTRDFTEYGKYAADMLAVDLVKCGAVVVSGLALGIDAVAHAGALKGGGKTVAVVGCGLDIDYPKPNAELRALIEKNGAVVSEYPPGTQPLPFHFPIRNRIISGLSRGIVVIEADEKSGSLITAGHALGQDRDVFAVPGRINDLMSRGTNKLIKQGAKPVMTVNDILEEYTYGEYDISLKVINLQQLKKKYRHVLQDKATETTVMASVPVETTGTVKKLPPEYLSETQLMIYNMLDESPRTADYITEMSGLRITQVLSALTQLEIYGLVTAHPGRMFSV